MTKGSGFGQLPGQPKKTKKKNVKREQASQKYDEMKKQGLPEFNIFVRYEGKDWIPAGSMTVDRSDKIVQAIFQQEQELLKGALRLYPKLSKYKDSLEYGYRFKEFPDEAIALAVRPQPTVGDKLAKTVTQLKEGLSSLFNQKKKTS
ncbi:HHL1-like protein [Tumidithrix elongata RA019]|uniref:HHL1-like protein n=1 Tax=Tumidithrix elongata BACA0141 TaxID=2716417 RepID=A0AAW9Q5I0_9CYAN|nr:HHL1-like protein [Tumidithrix elongata RA019]